MNAHRLLCIGVTTLVLAVSFSLRAADGDAEWKKVNDAMEGIKNPTEQPKSREEAIAMLKKGLTEFDAAYATALKAEPNNPSRWDAALFETMVGRAREFAGVPAPSKQAITLEEILKAEDAKPETKSQASLVSVMEAAEAAESPEGDPTTWLAKAEKHLKDFPAEKMNKMVEGKIASIKAASELKNKPLELKFTAVDGREVDVSKLQGKVVLIDFWATWCGPCVAELPNVIKAYKELHPKGFEIVGISLDSDKAELEAFVKEKGMEWPQYFDGKGWKNEISTKYGITSIPAMWLLNKKGMVVSTDARGGLEEQVAKLLAE
ncbi:TlpA disulfide reductase family protein [Prosthecobacter sp.]|uniref:TlpA family protein disulfide reductase n=1 Tax=Prosthecobacter sp. TaxID=1965333 RepID=UPI0024884E7D|nr:TlpA disulfide reductase family protein [Prosthecobacter sp.]MDI1311484.1 TlpA disulfide reductase family protein [Prosthecobacter sp.]